MEELQLYFFEKSSLGLYKEVSIPKEISFVMHNSKSKGEENNHPFFRKGPMKFLDYASDHGKFSCAESSGCTSTEAETDTDCSSLSNRSDILSWPDTHNDDKMRKSELMTKMKKNTVIYVHERQCEQEEDEYSADGTEEQNDEFIYNTKIARSPGRKRREAHPKILFRQRISNSSNHKAPGLRSRRRELHSRFLMN